MEDAYGRTKAPEFPKEPVTFSPLRPLRTALWSWLSLGLWSASYGPPTALPVMLVLGALGFATGFLADTYDGESDSPVPSLLVAAGAVALFIVSEALRACLRSAMHLDNEESREVWERRLTR